MSDSENEVDLEDFLEGANEDENESAEDDSSDDTESGDETDVDADLEAEPDAEGEANVDAEAEADADAEGDEDDEDEDEGPADAQTNLPETPIPQTAEKVPPRSVAEPQATSTTLSKGTQALQSTSLAPTVTRRAQFGRPKRDPKSYTIEAICAIAHPAPTHALAASACMTHMVTGSDDGFMRDYDIFASCNGKIFLSAPQRQHCGIVEGTIKAGQLRTWWENPSEYVPSTATEQAPLSPVYSLSMHSDALWGLAGCANGHVNLFSVRHETGRLHYIFRGHHDRPVSSLSLLHDERGFISGGWDGEASHWDLDTGQKVRSFLSHAQVAVVAIRPQGAPTSFPDAPTEPKQKVSQMDLKSTSTAPRTDPKPQPEEDAQSDTSFDPLFDDEPEDSKAKLKTGHVRSTQQRSAAAAAAAYKGNVPMLDPNHYASYSPDILLTACIDGQLMLWDRRAFMPTRGVGRLEMSDKSPPWCVSACWSVDGTQVYAGRRNGFVDAWDVRMNGRSSLGTPRLLRSLRNPGSSGAVSSVAALPDGKHIVCASQDNIRLWNVADADGELSGRSRNVAPFKIVPGHHGGFVSQILVDPSGRFMITASSNRGWHGDSTRTVLVHEMKSIF